MNKHKNFVESVRRSNKTDQILCVGHCHAFKMIYGKKGLANAELRCVDDFYEEKKKEKDLSGPVPELEIELRFGVHEMNNGEDVPKSGSWGSFYTG